MFCVLVVWRFCLTRLLLSAVSTRTCSCFTVNCFLYQMISRDRWHSFLDAGSPSVEQSLLSSYQSHLRYLSLLLRQPDKTCSCKSTDQLTWRSPLLRISPSVLLRIKGRVEKPFVVSALLGQGSLYSRGWLSLSRTPGDLVAGLLWQNLRIETSGSLSSCSFCLQDLPCFLLCWLPQTSRRCFS